MARWTSFCCRRLPVTKTKVTLARVLYRLLVPFCGKAPRIVERRGIRYQVDLSEGIDLNLFLFGSFQGHVTHCRYVTLEADALVFDVGANFGFMALAFAHQAPQGRIYAFEPTHYAFERLKRNLALNPEIAKRVVPINCFVSDSMVKNPGIKAYSSWKVDGSKAEDAHPIHLGTTKSAVGVESVTLDRFCSQNDVRRLDLLKIDTDGHEAQVLIGGRNVIAESRPQVIFELGLYTMQENNIDFSFFHKYFRSLDYRIMDAKSGHSLTPENHLSYVPRKGTIDAVALPD